MTVRATNDCACGCGDFPDKPKSLYRPGHDAKHVSNLVAAVLGGRLTEDEAADLTTSEKLREKFLRDLESKSSRRK